MAQGSSNLKSIIRSGNKGTSVSADVTSTPVSTSVEALDITLKTSLPAGTNTIGKLGLNDGIDIGDVTINNPSIAVTDNGASLTVDAPIATPVYVRLSNGTSAVDALPVTDNGGSLTVDGSVSISNFPATQPISGTVTVAQATGANLNATVTGTVSALQSGTWNINSITTFPTVITNDTAAIKTAVQLLDNAVGTDGAAIDSGMLRVGGTDGTNNQTLSVNTSGHLNIADGGNSITVDGTIAATQSGTWNIGSITTLPSLPAGNNNIGDVDVASLPGTVAADITAIKTATELLDNAVGIDGAAIAAGMLRVGGTDGTNNQTISVNTSGHINIADGGNSITVDGTVGVSGSVAVTGTFWPTTQAVSGTVTVAQATAANLNATVVGTVGISNFPTTQAVSIATLPALAAGTNNIGDVDVVSLPGTVAADITAIKTATELLDNAIGVDGAAIASTMLRVGGTDGTNNQMLSVNTLGHINIADGGNSITVDGTVGISGTVPVSGTFWQATQPVSIASAVPITDNGGSLTVDGSVSVSALPALPAGTNTIGNVSFVPNAVIANAPTNASTTAYAASLVVKASAGVLYMITGFNSRSSGQFIQLHDSATLPTDTSVPKITFYVESNSNFSLDLGSYGRAFSNGIVICNSSSGPTKTIGAADCWFDVQYK